MAFTDQEKQIIVYGKQNGKNADEITTALSRLRAGIQPEVPQQAPRAIGTDVAIGAAKGAGSTVKSLMDTAANSVPGYVAGPILGAIPAVRDKISGLIQPLKDLFQKHLGLTDGHLAADNTAQKVGKGLELGAELALPLGAEKAAILASEASKALEGITAVGADGIKAAVTSNKLPEQLMQRVARISKPKQSAFEQKAGASVGKYLVDRGIFGRPDQIVDQLYNRFNQSKGAVDNALAELPGRFKPSSVGVALKQLVGREARVSSPGAPSQDLERIRELQRNFTGQGLSHEQINEVKRLFERNIRLDYVKENAPEKVAQATNIDSAIRGWQFKTAAQQGFKNLPELNKETQLAKQLMDDLGGEYAGSAGNNAISLTDWITLSGGGPANAAMFLTKKAVTSKTVMSKTAQLMAKDKTVPDPNAVLGLPTIDNYLKFIQRTSP